MKVVVVGATGNVGTSVLTALRKDDKVKKIVGLARRVPTIDLPKTTWEHADVTKTDLAPLFEGADAVISLAWAIQPSHKESLLHQINVEGSTNVFNVAAKANVPSLIYASSVGAYSPRVNDEPVDESWPTNGIKTSIYSRQKALVEERLDEFEEKHASIRVVRLRPALTFKKEVAVEVSKLFFGHKLPASVLRKIGVPALPAMKGVEFQALHSLDVGEAYRLAVTKDVRGSFNIAADPLLNMKLLAKELHSRTVPFPASLLRFGMDLSWKLHIQPSDAGWLDMATQGPLLDTSRATNELGWKPNHSSTDAVKDLWEGMLEGAIGETPPLSGN